MKTKKDKINDLFEKDYTPDQVPMSEQEIVDNCKDLNLKWRDREGRCTHKKNNHRHNGGLSDCIYKHCKYFKECVLEEDEE